MEDLTLDAILHSRIREALLRDWDPIGIQEFSEAQDEYDSYVPELCELLLRKACLSEIFDFLWNLETEYMGLQGDRQRTEAFALQLASIGEVRQTGETRTS